MPKLWLGRPPGLTGWVVLGSLTLASTTFAAGQDDKRPKGQGKRVEAPVPQLIQAERSATSLRVRDLPLETPKAPDPTKLREIPNEPDEQEERGRRLAPVSTPDGALQSTMPAAQMPAAAVSVQGISQLTQGQVSGFFVSPPDTVGDVGPNHYVQCVNLACQIFNKIGSSLASPFTLRSLFTPLGGACATTNDGDPIVLYDPLADRWHLSQFSVATRPPSHECVAVSQTGDPTGAYYLYDFVIPGGYFNDYPKFGVWPDGYYMTAPLFEGPVFGQGMFVMNRTKMLAGDPTAEMIFFDLTLSHPGLQRILPADIDGVPPPPGTPNYVATTTADEFGDSQDGIRLFEVRPDFANPSASTFTELPSLAVASYDPTFTEVSGTCSGLAFTSRDDIDQPAPATCNMRVDSLSGRPMHRLAYRNFGTYESLVINHTVDVNATPPSATSGHLAGIRYYELRRSLPGGSFAVQEQATFSPDAVHRWMGSAAMDAQGNLAVGYSVSDATATFPGVRYAGRLASDPPGGLSQGEATLVAGGRSQTSTASRWGDYSGLSVDPADDCTFWYTQEYYDLVAPGGCSVTACWQTRIGSFKFPGCVSTATFGTLQGTVTDATTSLPLAGVLVQANGYSAVTSGAGTYSMSVAAGTYAVTASKTGYGQGTAAGVVVPGAGTTTQNFSLGSGSIAGTIRDSLTTSPIGGALVQVSGGPHVLTSGSGAYSIPLPAGPYSVSVTKANYFPGSLTGLVVGTSGVTAGDLSLTPAPILAVSATAVNDSIGNNNGAVDFGECFKLSVTLVNSGTVGATGITANLATGTPGVVISQGVSAYPNLAAGGGTGTNTVPFVLTSDPAPTSAGKPIALTLNLTTASGPLSIPFVLATGGGAPTLVSATGPVPIPDNNGTGAMLAIPVSGFTSVLSKVKVSLRITHTFDGDLILRLVSPDNTSVLLAYGVGGGGAGFGTDCPASANDTTFDDAAATAITAGTAPFVGSFRPQEPLAAFGGKSGPQVNGNWQLQVIDIGPADIGSIECVTLTLNDSTFGGCTGTSLGSYFTVTPCRLLDTRNLPPGPLAGPALAAGAGRTFQVTGNCGIPAITATSVFLNITVVSPTVAGNLRIFPTGTPLPTVSALNYSAGQTRGNNGVYRLDASGRLDIYCSQASGTAHAVVDLAGYFVE